MSDGDTGSSDQAGAAAERDEGLDDNKARSVPGKIYQ